MEQEIAAPALPQPQPKKIKRGGTTYASKLGDWQSFLAPLASNAADLPHLEIPRAQLAALLAQAVELKNQQAGRQAGCHPSSSRRWSSKASVWPPSSARR